MKTAIFFNRQRTTWVYGKEVFFASHRDEFNQLMRITLRMQQFIRDHSGKLTNEALDACDNVAPSRRAAFMKMSRTNVADETAIRHERILLLMVYRKRCDKMKWETIQEERKTEPIMKRTRARKGKLARADAGAAASAAASTSASET